MYTISSGSYPAWVHYEERITIRMEVEGFREAGRSTQGVNLINLQAGDTIGSIERFAKIEDGEEAGKAQASPPRRPSRANRVDSRAWQPLWLPGFHLTDSAFTPYDGTSLVYQEKYMPAAVYSPKEATEIREEWIHSLDALIRQTRVWAQARGWTCEIVEREIGEEAIGTYVAPALEVDVPEYDGRVTLEPKARVVSGAAGRVDLYAWPTLSRVFLLRDSRVWADTGESRWTVLTESRVRLDGEFNQEMFYSIVTQWLSEE